MGRNVKASRLVEAHGAPMARVAVGLYLVEGVDCERCVVHLGASERRSGDEHARRPTNQQELRQHGAVIVITQCAHAHATRFFVGKK